MVRTETRDHGIDKVGMASWSRVEAQIKGGADLPTGVGLKGKRFHFVGAGGAGMSGLAELFVENGAIVSGSDSVNSEVIDRLIFKGCDIQVGHRVENIGDQVDGVIVTAAIKKDNPELVEAVRRGVRVYKYAEAVGELMDFYEGIAVSGTHGKSTSSGWLVSCLKRLGTRPNFLIGGRISELGASCGVGDSKYFVAEACEYDRSFLNLRPKIGCILNIETDHLDYYKDEDAIVDAFYEFAENIKEGGILIANGDDANVVKVLTRTTTAFETFGFGKDCNYQAKNLQLEGGVYGFDIYHNGEFVGRSRSGLAGRHNVLNGLAVFAMATNTGAKSSDVIESLSRFCGIDRRLMFKGEFGGIKVVDDYAHHPTEIRASLSALREKYEPGRLICVFQPHQYSRTRFLLDDFAKSFKLSDLTILPEIYFVRDEQSSKELVNSAKLAKTIEKNGNCAEFINGFDAICDYLKKNVVSGDLVVTMGAGDIWKVSDEYIQWLRENS